MSSKYTVQYQQSYHAQVNFGCHFICELFLNGLRAQKSGKSHTAKYNFKNESLSYTCDKKTLNFKSLAEIGLEAKLIQWKLHKFTLQP